MSVKISKKVNIAILIIEIISIVGLLLLEHISSYYGGIMHHLYYKRAQHMTSFYSSYGIMIHSAIIMVIMLAFKSYLNKRYNIEKMGLLYIFGIITLAVFYIPFTKGLYTYSYLLIILELMFGIEVAKAIIKVV